MTSAYSECENNLNCIQERSKYHPQMT